MSTVGLLIAAATAGQLALAPAEHYRLSQLLDLGFELKAAVPSGAGDMLFLQGRLGPGKPPIIVKCLGQTIAVSANEDCRRVY